MEDDVVSEGLLAAGDALINGMKTVVLMTSQTFYIPSCLSSKARISNHRLAPIFCVQLQMMNDENVRKK